MLILGALLNCHSLALAPRAAAWVQRVLRQVPDNISLVCFPKLYAATWRQWHPPSLFCQLAQSLVRVFVSNSLKKKEGHLFSCLITFSATGEAFRNIGSVSALTVWVEKMEQSRGCQTAWTVWNYMVKGRFDDGVAFTFVPLGCSICPLANR